MDWTADSFETGTRAAACGGTTTIVDYATADRGVTMPDALAEWGIAVPDGTCTANYAFHMALAEWNERNRADLSAMREAGVSFPELWLRLPCLQGSHQFHDRSLKCHFISDSWFVLFQVSCWHFFIKGLVRTKFCKKGCTLTFV